jgi:hypothetical protein
MIEMDDNLESQYEQVVTYLEQYQDFIQKLVFHVAKSNVPNPFAALKNSWGLQRETKLLSSKTSETMKRLFLEAATEEQKRNEYFPIVVSDYSMDLLSTHVATRFAEFDFGKLKKLHEVKKNNIAFNPVRYMIGFYIAIGTVLLKSVPQSVVERFTPYRSFEEIVFWVLALVLALVLLYFMPSWRKYEFAKRDHEFIGDILAYITIKQGE